jgi:thiol-disulfide isomerase/thioredoxin
MDSRALQIAGLVLAALFGVWLGLRLHSSQPPRSSAVTTAVGEASPPSPSDVEDPWNPAASPLAKIPERLPEFALGDRTGKSTPISTWRGKSLILNFWATWCAPCRREIPLLETLHQEWQNRDVQVVGVAVDDRAKVLAYADELKIPYPLLIGEQDALDVVTAMGVESAVFPFTVFTDRRGQVVALFVGELHRPQADLILSVVKSVNEDRVQLAAARRSIADGLHALADEHPG